MSNIAFSGVITALSTPFASGRIDQSSFMRLLRDQMDQGIDGFVVNGTTGESPTLDWEEVSILYRWAREFVGTSRPLLVGVGSNSTAKTCELAKRASAWRPEGLLVVVPYYNRPPQRGLVAHFTEVAAATDVPIVLYNVPSRTVAALAPETVGELARNNQICGLKDATGDMSQHAEIRKLVPKSFSLLSGDDATCVDYCQQGGHGVISVSSHIIGREMKEYIAAKDPNGFRQKFAEFLNWLYIEPNPIPLKYALHLRAVFSSPELRLPLAALDHRHHEGLASSLRKIGKL